MKKYDPAVSARVVFIYGRDDVQRKCEGGDFNDASNEGNGFMDG